MRAIANKRAVAHARKNIRLSACAQARKDAAPRNNSRPDAFGIKILILYHHRVWSYSLLLLKYLPLCMFSRATHCCSALWSMSPHDCIISCSTDSLQRVKELCRPYLVSAGIEGGVWYHDSSHFRRILLGLLG